jgi:hypothetical protein
MMRREKYDGTFTPLDPPAGPVNPSSRQKDLDPGI